MTIRRRTSLTQGQQKIHQQLHPGANVGNQRPSLLMTGEQAERARVAESQRQSMPRQKKGPYRLWVGFKGDEEARTKEIIILDSDIKQCPCLYEHALLNPETGRRDLYEMCIKAVEAHCPVCEKFGDSYYVQMVSIIELLKTPIQMRDGGEKTYIRKLLPIKSGQMETYIQLCHDTFGGNMRGAHILVTRDANQRSSAIGVPRPLIENGQIVQYSEQDLEQAFGHPAYTNQQGDVVKQANEDLYPFDYPSLFPTPTGEELRSQYGGLPPAGSTQETNQTWNGQQQHRDRITARDVKRHVQAQQPQQDDNYLNDLDDEIPF